MMALRAGAHHVTAVERWLYLALLCKECLEANKVGRAFPLSPSSLSHLRAFSLCLTRPLAL